MIAISLIIRHQPCLSLFIFVHRVSLPSSACSADHIEIFTRFRWRIWVNGLNQQLKDHQRRQVTHAATIKGE
jgi:hypothetical protein